MAGKLPPETFEFYVGLGLGRTYQAVADHYGVSKRAVAKRAAKDKWQPRLEALIAGARASVEVADGDDSARSAGRVVRLQDAMHEVMTPVRMKALMSSLLKSALQDGDVGAARLLMDRVLGRPRNEPLPATSIDLPDGLETTSDVKRAANALLQGVTDGSISPEDARTAATVVEAARKAIETEDLERRLAAVEERQKAEQNP